MKTICNRCGKCANGTACGDDVYCDIYYTMSKESPWRGKKDKACQWFKATENEQKGEN